MNNVNMANMPLAGGPVGGPTPMMSNPLAAQQIQSQGNNRTVLNTYIYDYFLRERMYDCARAMLNSEQTLNVIKESPGHRRDANGNVMDNGVGDDPMDTDSKDDIDSKRPPDLPPPNVPAGADNCFLYEWFCLFWDMLMAQRNKPGISPQVSQYVNHTQQQNRQRQNEQQAILRGMRQDIYSQGRMMGMPNGMQVNAKQQNLARTAMANNQNNPQAMHMLQQKQNQMQRDGSNMDGNQNRPGSPGSAENAPSPSKRPRLDGSGPFNPQQGGMMPNGQRPQQGMPGQQVGNGPRSAAIAQHMLSTNGIDPANLSAQQFQNFQTQPPQNQAKSIQTYAQNLQQHHGQQMPNKQMPNPAGPQGQASPMMANGPDGAAINAFYNANEMGGPGGMRPGGPGGAQGAGGSNHALQDYQMQLMLLEQQNKKRLMMARQEQDSMGGIPRGDGSVPGGPGAPGGPGPNGQPFQDSSPQGARSGTSPNPTEQMKRGTPQMNPAAVPSPLPEGAQSRGSPNAINFMQGGMDPSMQPQFFKGMNGMDSNMVAAMNAGMRPPSSHPNQAFNGPMNPQLMRPQQGAQGGPPMQWQGPNGNAMAPQGPQGPQGQVQGTPQQRSMPPPSAPPPANGATAGRTQTSSPQQNNAAPPTPQQSNKAAPKKKDAKAAKNKSAAQKKAQTTGATPASEAAQEPEPPTPVTPANTANFNKNGQNVGAQPAVNAPASAPQPAPTAVAAQQAHQDASQMNSFSMDNNNLSDFIPTFADPMQSGDVLQDFDFDSFLHDDNADPSTFDFNTATFGIEGAGEIGAE